MRGTLHLVAATDEPWLRSLLAPELLRRSERRYAELGLDAATLVRAENAVVAGIEQANALSRSAIAALLADAGLPASGQAPFHVLRRCSLLGAVCHCSSTESGEQAFVPARDWFAAGPAAVDLDSVDLDRAAYRLAERFVRAHAPVSLRDFLTWSRLTAAFERSAWAQLLDDGAVERCSAEDDECVLPAGAAATASSNRLCGERAWPAASTASAVQATTSVLAAIVDAARRHRGVGYAALFHDRGHHRQGAHGEGEHREDRVGSKSHPIPIAVFRLPNGTRLTDDVVDHIVEQIRLRDGRPSLTGA